MENATLDYSNSFEILLRGAALWLKAASNWKGSVAALSLAPSADPAYFTSVTATCDGCGNPKLKSMLTCLLVWRTSMGLYSSTFYSTCGSGFIALSVYGLGAAT